MKYLVSTAATLRFVDGSQVELVPGIHSFNKQVAEHWAFGAHAKAVNDSEIENLNSDADLTLKVNVLEGEITDLKAQVATKDGEITDLKAQVATKDGEITDLKAQVALLTNAQDSALTDDGKTDAVQPDAEKETGNAKKQSSSNK
ncbi:STY1053 family phage-associated protein [Rahnella inusitata]|uniref:STY1053 family phage-associated protein n=1 Tax=Rahnella inusitata TaxID=58169 RepID=UPI001BC841D6|nr:hypothetical protein [Rahnella inusitata]QUT14077.1 hypothetical protein I2123_15380 [Rahnella inusitata]